MAVSLPIPYVPPIWLEGRVGSRRRRSCAATCGAAPASPAGEGRPVLLIPGFLAGDGTLTTMSSGCGRAGGTPPRAGFRANVACSEDACLRLEERLEELAADTGSRVAIIGQSRGGVLARALAARRPDLVSGIVTLGSPVVSQLAVHPLVLAQVPARGCDGHGQGPRAVDGQLPAGLLLRAVPRRPLTRLPARSRLRQRLLAHRRDRRLALLPGPRRRPTTSRSPPRTAA